MDDMNSDITSLQTKASSSGGESSPSSGSFEALNRAQKDNNKKLSKVVDILERARKNLKELEQQRLSHLEGLKELRDRLFQENQELRLTIQGMPGGFASAPPISSRAVPGSSKTATEFLNTAATSSSPRYRSSAKAVKLFKKPSLSESLVTSEAPPRASSSRNLQKKESQQSQLSYKSSKHSMLPSNQDNVSGHSVNSEQSTSARSLKQRFLSNFNH